MTDQDVEKREERVVADETNSWQFHHGPRFRFSDAR